MTPLELVQLPPLMALTSGSEEIVVALLDGPVVLDHPDLLSARIHDIPGGVGGRCRQASSSAGQHGTFVAGILSARRGSAAPAICPGCSLLVRPIFPEEMTEGELLPSATAQQLAAAIGDCVAAGARVLNLSAAMSSPSTRDERQLRDALDYAARCGVLVAAAAGNQATLGSSAITRHPWVIPVVGYGLTGRPMAQSNLGSSMGRRGLGAPGEEVTSLSPRGAPRTLAGTSFATAFVTGAIALLWSMFPAAAAIEVKHAITTTCPRRRTSVVPPLLNAWAAYSILSRTQPRKATA
ncbi:MAG: S8 family serine peptidase [Pseudonocardiaceae bacterium]